MMRERRMPPITRQVRVDRCHACCVLGDPTRPYTVAPQQAVDRAGLGPRLGLDDHHLWGIQARALCVAGADGAVGVGAKPNPEQSAVDGCSTIVSEQAAATVSTVQRSADRGVNTNTL